MITPSFRAEHYELHSNGGTVTLEPIAVVAAQALGEAIAQIEPWATLGTNSARLISYLTIDDPHCCRRIIRYGDANAGVVAVRSPWLYGPYLTLLAVLPGYQNSGIGSAVLQWMEDEAKERPANLWVCASSFNAEALAFYERRGFGRVGDLPDLVAPGFTEVLLRKPLGEKIGKNDLS
jgi:ribosomal protein S18 acetylase RimI-like enzyme